MQITSQSTTAITLPADDPSNGQLAALFSLIERAQSEAKDLSSRASQLSNLVASTKQIIINISVSLESQPHTSEKEAL